MKDTKGLLLDMIAAINAIETYQVPTFEQFKQDGKTQDAIMFNLVILGEAANKTSPEFRDLHPELPWASMIGTRNIIVHGYDQIKLNIVWDILTKELRRLKQLLEELVSEI